MLALQTQRVLQRRLDVSANNLANINTSGFKADDVLAEAAATDARAEDAPYDIHFVRDMGLVRDMSQGPIASTGNPLDLAIEGAGFFMVQGANGETLYTRDGAFSLAGDGRLVTSDGRPVLNSGGAPIQLDSQGESPSIGRDGVIRVAGVEAGQIGMANFVAPNALAKVGDNLWSAQGQAVAPFEGVIEQGALEGSNVRPVNEITRLIEITRAYQSVSNIVASADELRRSAIERLGR